MHIQAAARARTHGDLWAMRFTHPRFITLSYIRSPCLPTQCGMVAALWLRDSETEWGMDEELAWGCRGLGHGGRASQVVVGDVQYIRLPASTLVRTYELITQCISVVSALRRILRGFRWTHVQKRFLNQLFHCCFQFIKGRSVTTRCVSDNLRYYSHQTALYRRNQKQTTPEMGWQEININICNAKNKHWSHSILNKLAYLCCYTFDYNGSLSDSGYFCTDLAPPSTPQKSKPQSNDTPKPKTTSKYQKIREIMLTLNNYLDTWRKHH